MAYSNNHYVPQFILRRFGNKINRYNVKTGEVKIKGSTLNAFSDEKIYPEWLEKMLGSLESRIANLIDNKVLNAEGEVTLSRADNILIKKFFTIATLRVPDSSLFSQKHLESEESLKQQGFKEVFIENESDIDYAYRTMKAVLESNSIEELYDHPQVTYEACKWFSMFYSCFVTIWDSKESKEDFVITDNGMNCEHDKTRFLTFNFDGELYKNEKDEMLKAGYLMKKLEDNKNNPQKTFTYLQVFTKMSRVHANYYLFAVSGTRTIALINPFYRMYDDPTIIQEVKETPDVWPTLLSEKAMESNSSTYVESGKTNDDDLFHYRIKDLSLEEVIIINCMMLDRVYYWVGFDNSARIARSLNTYTMIAKNFQRNNYDRLVEYLYSLGCDFPRIKKYSDIKDKLTSTLFTDKEVEYIKFCYNLIKKAQCYIK